jgi:hypothetical protein
MSIRTPQPTSNVLTMGETNLFVGRIDYVRFRDSPADWGGGKVSAK